MSNLLLKKRGGFDELYTPAYAVKLLLKYLPPIRSDYRHKILCPFDDYSSNYVKVLKAAGYDVTYSHQWDDKDFFDYTKEEVKDYDFIISNPPYSIKDKILEHLYELNIPFAMLLPLVTLEGVKRNKLFNENGVEMLVLDKRTNFMEGKGKSAYFNTSYFCHNVLEETLIFHTVDKSDI